MEVIIVIFEMGTLTKHIRKTNNGAL